MMAAETVEQQLERVQKCWTSGKASEKAESAFPCPLPWSSGALRTIYHPWPDLRKMADGNPWLWWKSVPSWTFLAQMNIMRPAQETFATRVTARRPRVTVIGKTVDDELKAEGVAALVEQIQDAVSSDAVHYAAEKDALVTTCSWLWVEHDPLAGNDLNLRLDFLKPDDAAVPPGTTGLSVVQRGPLWFVRRYLANVAELRDAPWSEGANWTEFDAAIDNVGSAINPNHSSLPMAGADDPNVSCYVYELWTGDRPVEWDEDVAGVSVVKTTASSVIRVGGGQVLNPLPKWQANPEAHDRIPVVPVLYDLRGDCLYHTSLMGDLAALQIELVRVKQQAMEFINRSGGPTLVYNKELIPIAPTNEPTRVIGVEEGNVRDALTVVPGPPFPRHLAEYPSIVLSQAQDVAMQHDQMQGKPMVSHVSATAATNSYESDLTFVQRNAMHLTWAMESWVNLALAILANHDDWKARVRVVSEATSRAKTPGAPPASDVTGEAVDIDSKYLKDWKHYAKVEDTSNLPEALDARNRSISMWTQALASLPPALWTPVLTYLRAPEFILAEVRQAAAAQLAPPTPPPGAGAGPPGGPRVSEQIAYKDLPPDLQAQLAAQVGLQPGQMAPPPGMAGPPQGPPSIPPGHADLLAAVDALGIDPSVLAQQLQGGPSPDAMMTPLGQGVPMG
jgi:hypothetical protein